jgi:hypothetical protein
VEYLVNGKRYILHYQELKARYQDFCGMTDEQFLANLPEATHLAVVISWLKELETEDVLSDKGVIHELVHLIHIPESPELNLQEIREAFRIKLMLA